MLNIIIFESISRSVMASFYDIIVRKCFRHDYDFSVFVVRLQEPSRLILIQVYMREMNSIIRG